MNSVPMERPFVPKYSFEAQQVDAKGAEPSAVQPGLLSIPYRTALKQDPSPVLTGSACMQGNKYSQWIYLHT